MATTISAAVEVLRKAGRPLSVEEVWDGIMAAGTWRPPAGGKAPRRTLQVQMARASEGYAGSRPTRTKTFRRPADGRFDLLKR